jgi:hypothetical protein
MQWFPRAVAPRRDLMGTGRPAAKLGVDMDDTEIFAQINDLVTEEHDLRERLGRGEVTADEEHARLRSLEESLDQCWDLLRQRRARRAAGEDPGDASARPTGEVEGYLQ